MSTRLKFLHYRDLVDASDVPADLTVLELLRRRRLQTGTKEGCASGDCGACTVVVAELTDDGRQLRYQAINSCIAYAGSLHGKQLITVENLQSTDGLHPVQSAMVQQHASQCGFCTPGIVMSLFALWKNTAPGALSRGQIDQALGGNLCRCTGYRPIIDAAQQIAKQPDREDNFSGDQDDTIASLRSIEQSESVEPGGHFHRPASLEALCELRAALPQARLLAGGTDLALETTQQLKSIAQIISLQSVPELNRVQLSDERIHIGAGVTLAECEQQLGARFPALQELLIRFGSRQIRAVATVGGNIANASPIGDLAPVFLALDAQIVLQSSRGKREIPLRDFFLGYRKTALHDDELVVEINFAWSQRMCADNLHVYKVSKRLDDDISAVCAVFYIEVQDDAVQLLRTGFGGMAAVPARALALEQALTRQSLQADWRAIGSVALQRDFQPISDARASAGYRRAVAGNLLLQLAADVAARPSGRELQ